VPRNARLRNTRGYFYLSQNDLDRAMADFDDAIGLDLEYEQPYNNRGLVRIAREDYTNALLDFDAALAINPDYLDARNNRGFALMRLERHEEAIADFTTVLEKNESYVNAWNNRGLALAALERHEEAIDDFTHAIELQTSNLKYLLHRSTSLEALGRIEEAQADQFAVAWFQQLAAHNNTIGRDQHNPHSWIARGRHLLRGDRLEDAISDFNRALSEDPLCADAHVALAEVFLAQEDVAGAIAEATKAIECEPSFAAYSLRGDVHFQQEDYESAIADYEAARRLDSQVVQAYRSRSEQLTEAGDVEQAGAMLERATQIEATINSGFGSTDETEETSASASEESTEQPEQPEQSAAAEDSTTIE
jgi:tetratricopeptide (TPR) repeat protein